MTMNKSKEPILLRLDFDYLLKDIQMFIWKYQ